MPVRPGYKRKEFAPSYDRASGKITLEKVSCQQNMFLISCIFQLAKENKQLLWPGVYLFNTFYSERITSPASWFWMFIHIWVQLIWLVVWFLYKRSLSWVISYGTNYSLIQTCNNIGLKKTNLCHYFYTSNAYINPFNNTFIIIIIINNTCWQLMLSLNDECTVIFQTS